MCLSLAREGAQNLADSRPVSSVNSRQFSFVPTVDNIPPERFENAAGSLERNRSLYTGVTAESLGFLGRFPAPRDHIPERFGKLPGVVDSVSL